MTKTIRVGLLALVLTCTGLATVACKGAAAPNASAAAAGSVSGAWTTQWGGSQTCNLTLQQSAANVTGNYTTSGAPPGTVTGTFVGNVLTGTWADEAGGRGAMVLTFAADTRSFTGTWGTGDSTTNGGTWNGSR